PCGSTTSAVATLTVSIVPAVTTSPLSTNVCAGTVVSFTAAASGTPTLQWQASSGGGFTNIPGATASPLSFTTSVSQSNNQYRAVFSNPCGSPTSTVATLTVNNPRITTDPPSTTACTGTVVSFTSAASGTPAPTLQ